MEASKKVAHTLGPWNVRTSSETDWALDVLTDRKDATVATVWGIATRVGNSVADGTETIANARLIAAAPRMLEKLAEAVSLWEDMLKAKSWATFANDAEHFTRSARAILRDVDGHG